MSVSLTYWQTNVSQPPEVLALHDKYRGERLFVFGTGPSLRDMSLEFLAHALDEYSFGANKLMLWEDLPSSPAFHGLSEQEDMPNAHVYTKHGVEHFACHWASVRQAGWQWVAKAPDAVHMDSHGCFGLGDDLPPLPSGGATPITLGVQLGAWMGFDPIYLLGCDNTANGQVFNGAAPRPRPRIDKVERSVARAVREFQDVGRTLMDCTPGGGLSKSGVIEYMALEKVL